MKLNVPNVENKTEFLLTFWIDCTENELTPPVLWRDKRFTMHAGLTQQLLSHVHWIQHLGRTMQFYPVVASPFFCKKEDFRNHLFSLWDSVFSCVFCEGPPKFRTRPCHNSSSKKIKATSLAFVVHCINLHPMWYISVPQCCPLLAKEWIKLDLCHHTQSVFICKCVRGCCFCIVSWNQATARVCHGSFIPSGLLPRLQGLLQYHIFSAMHLSRWERRRKQSCQFMMCVEPFYHDWKVRLFHIN